MHDRSALGPADVTDEQLAVMVADLLGTDPDTTQVVESRADRVDYDLPAITTAGRHWVSGTARCDGADQRFRIFVKHIQSWSRHPFFQLVPPEHRQAAADGVEWRTEARVYRSGLGEVLPLGLAMPRALGVFDLDEESNAVWLEAVPVTERSWDLPRYAEAARLLGRFATDAQVMETSRRVGHDMTMHSYYEGRLSMQVLPALRDDGVWHHPLVAGAFDDELHRRLLEAADRAAAYTEELERITHVAAHGDACPNNLLSTEDDDDFVLIDYGFFGPAPIGFDLSQLLVGDVQVGRRSGDDLAVVDEVDPRRLPGRPACRGVLDPRRRRTPRPRAAADALHRTVDDPARAPRRGADTRAVRPRRAAGRHRSVQPRPLRRHRLSGYCLARSSSTESSTPGIDEERSPSEWSVSSIVRSSNGSWPPRVRSSCSRL